MLKATRDLLNVLHRVLLRHRSMLLAFCLVASSLPPPLVADDWPEWRGPRRDGVARETAWRDGWTADRPPKLLWRAAVGKGHAALSISAGRAFTLGWDGRQETLFCFDAASGALRWQRSWPCATIKQWPGPRATPTVAGDRVYTLGQHGLVQAWSCDKGELIWKVALPASYNPDVDYGFAGSPLVEGELLILGTGQRGLALRLADGVFAWGHDGKPGACASPVRCDIDGKRAVVLVTNEGGARVRLVGVAPGDGQELWRSAEWPEKWGAACVDPVVRDRSIFLTTAEQHAACGRFTLVEGKLQLDWTHPKFAAYTGACVLVGDGLYGVTKAGVLKCLDWHTGKERWAQRGFDGHDALLAVGQDLLVQSSRRGELVVVEASDAGYREVRRLKVFEQDGDDGATFTAPVVAQGRLYCRSYAGDVVCYATRGK